ncbi:spermidine synthase [Sphingomonas sp.]|uniref:spermidine synthase n=1 Tax=Sphingomonas sp. TaxID=28214 RepID=UPI000DB3CC41|nr:spermidine synthase [Sphingomonas sp.]PZU10722.1 MAG: spermidine synthase [Sphingomonas sp.]
MKPREVIGVAEVPGGPPLRLIRHDDDFMILLERNELMSTRKSGSEKALGQMTCDRLSLRSPRLLIGGYGMGFTLRAALEKVGADARIVVAELVPGIVEWARGPMAALTAGCLDDARVEIRIDDVGRVMEQGGYDAILLDVDNGPDGLTRPANDGLYSTQGLARARAALNPGGILAVWSAGDDPAFTARLKKAGFVVEDVRVRARENGKGPIHVIWFARKR